MNYTGNTDPRDGALPGTLKLYELLTKGKMGMTPLGVWANRPMKGSNPPRLSVHATGRAMDCGYKADREKWAHAFADWLSKHYETLGIEEIHDYSFGEWGRGFRCSRKELGGKAGWKTWTATDNGGSGSGSGLWLHIEVSPKMAKDSGVLIASAWKQLNASDPPPLP
jgi:hypothetical protein